MPVKKAEQDPADNRGAINVWTCESCGCHTVAIHRDAGVTPMFLDCQAGTGCGGMAVSAMYPPLPAPPHIMAELKWEWYRPDDEELATAEAAVRDHVERRGLLIRPIQPDMVPR